MPLGHRIVLAIVSGIAIGVVAPLRVTDAAALAIATASCAVAMDGLRARRLVLLICLTAVAAANGALARDRALASPLLAWFDGYAPDDRAADPVNVTGILARDAAISENGVRLLLDVRSINLLSASGDHRPHSEPGRIQVHVSGDMASSQLSQWTAGRRITAPIVLRRPQGWRNPGGPDEHWVQLRRSFDLLGTIKSAALVHVTPGAWWDELAARVRARVRGAARTYVAPHGLQSAAIVTAILIGDRAGLSDDVQRRLQTAGTYHVIAISGGNVALLTAFCLLGLRGIVRSPRGTALGTLAVVCAYGWIVGGEPSVRRAVVGGCLYLAVGLVGLAPRALNVLGVVAALVLIADPLTVIDVGAWLSFGATLGIILGAARFQLWATGGNDPRPSTGSGRPELVEGRSRFAAVRTLWRSLLGLFSATLAAELILLPVSAAVFSRVSLFGLVLNFIAIPAMGVVEIAGLVTTAVAVWWPGAASIAGLVAHMAATWLVDSSTVVDTASWLSWRVPPTSLVWTLVFYAAGVVFLRQRGWRWPRRTAAAAIVASLVVIVTAPGGEFARPRFGWLRLTTLDVGQGDSILVQFPTGQSMLVDSGGVDGPFDIGGRVVTPAVWALGARRLDWLVISHAHIDHIGGALSVTADLRPREVWEGIPVAPNPELRALRTEALRRGIVWRQALAGQRLQVGSVLIDVLNPPTPDWERRRVSNDDSIVLRLRFGDVEMVLTGDAGQEFEGRAPKDDAHLPVHLLKVGHHGSRSASSAGFLDAFRPTVAFVSVGRGNLFGHPAPDIVARYDQLGTTLFRTDRDGAVTIETDGRQVEIRTMTGRRARVISERTR